MSVTSAKGITARPSIRVCETVSREVLIIHVYFRTGPSKILFQAMNNLASPPFTPVQHLKNLIPCCLKLAKVSKARTKEKKRFKIYVFNVVGEVDVFHWHGTAL